MQTELTSYRRFDSLLPAEQDRAEAALDAAALDLIAGGADETAVRAAARRHVGDLALDELELHWLLVEQAPIDPRTTEMRDGIVQGWQMTPMYAAVLDDCYANLDRSPGTVEEAALMLCTRGEVRPMSLLDGLRLLAGPSSPAPILAQRRAALAKLRTDHQAAKVAEAATVKAEAERWARLKRENAARNAAWDKLPAPLQLLFVAVDQLGGKYADLALALESVAARGATPTMPDSFHPELRRREEAGALPSRNAATVTTIREERT